jgi:PAS domain S-box-containing protein
MSTDQRPGDENTEPPLGGSHGSQEDADLRLLVDSVQDFAMIFTDTERRVVRWSKGAEHVLGWSEDEARHKSEIDLIFTPEDKAAGAPQQEQDAALRQGRAEDERWHLKKDGSRFWGSGVMVPLYEPATGQLRGFGKIFRDLTERRRYEERLRASLERESRIAEVLQRPLTLQVAEDTFPGLLVATRYEPAWKEAQVGGDFLDAFALPRNRVALAVGDASGKGLAAAARSIQVKEVLRAFTREYPHGLTNIVARLNDFVCDTKHYEEQPNEGFVTLTLVILDPVTGEASVANAGAEPPLLLRAGGAVEVIEVSGLPLGVERGEFYHAAPLRLSAGDTLVLSTDGITEARKGGQFLGFEGLERLVREALPAPSLSQMAGRIVEEARAFCSNGFTDDVCLLLARRR